MKFKMEQTLIDVTTMDRNRIRLIVLLITVLMFVLSGGAPVDDLTPPGW
ncbi:MAG: hypothetical protein R3272_11285 [Candidatus Promineifilaceae bacterium]|nr:hypothetical protein [Candidatus Promineifilaceae bacterium]